MIRPKPNHIRNKIYMNCVIFRNKKFLNDINGTNYNYYRGYVR